MKAPNKNHDYKILRTITINRAKTSFSRYKGRIGNLMTLGEKQNWKCCECGLSGVKFMLGIDNGGGKHWDLYSKDNTMMTIDHIHPKSKGGRNHISNYQLMCKVCNENKADHINDIQSFGEFDSQD